MLCAACELVKTEKELCPDCKKVQTDTEIEWQRLRKTSKDKN